MDREDISLWFSNQGSAKSPLIGAFSQYLSVQDAVQIFEQFHSNNWIPNGQVLWSGIPRRTAQEWADKHHLQTLTTAMGLLMDENHPDCPRWKKTSQQWSKYIHGASAIFAWRIAQGEKVTVLSPPPPERFHPSGLSSYQVIEEPIIKGLICQSAVDQILMAHPTVTESEDFLYEAWPEDQSSLWLARFGSRGTKRKWRDTGHGADKLRLKQLVVAYSEQRILSIEHTDANHLEKKEVRRETHSITQEIHQYSQSQEMEKYKGRLNMRQEENKTAHSNNISGQIAKANTDTQIKPIKKCKEAVKAWAEAQKATARKLKAERERKAKAKDKEVAQQKLKQEEKEQAKVQKAAAQKLKAERKAQVKAQEKIRQKRKEDQKAQAKAQELIAERKRKAKAKEKEVATQKLKQEQKGQAKAQKAAAQKLKAERKAQVKAQEKIRQKRKEKQKAQAKAQELKAEKKKKATAKEKEVATRKLKQEQKEQTKVQKAAAQKLKGQKEAQANRNKARKTVEATKKAKAKIQEWASGKT
ncbi:reticulocyte-binding protein 2 homolog a [Aspergillus udagawae]|uniref:Reticulocyte-binding protein 2 homolog a n=1 Tax=Aspergillus udagawae TaxID=91492 RepID=A0A8H3N1V5_9EURO|nr:reticulocyte-binding protein 2 homolog a [Aspergillus udagawae]